MIKNQLIVYLKCIGSCLKLVSNLINYLPCLFSTEIIEQYNHYYSTYRGLAELCREEHLYYEDNLLESDIIVEMIQVLKTLGLLLKNNVLLAPWQSLVEKLEALQKINLTNLVTTDSEILGNLEKEILITSNQLSQLTEQLIREIDSLKHSLPKKHRAIQTSVCDSMGIDKFHCLKADYELLEAKIDSLKNTCYIINQGRLLNIFSYFHSVGEDFWFICDVIRLDKLAEIFQQYREVLNKQYENYDKKLIFLKKRIDNPNMFAEIIRIYRAIHYYEKWGEYLTETEKKLHERLVAPDLSLAIQLKRLTTYEKSAFFNQHFKSQRADSIINELFELISQSDIINKTAKEILIHLRLKKSQALAFMQHTEQRLTEHQSYYQVVAAEGLLAVSQQPAFHLGTHSIGVLNSIGNASNLPILSQSLPDVLNEARLQTLAGMSFLGISLYASHLMGYSYHFIASINHILLSHIDLLIKIGKVCDLISQKIGLPLLNQAQSLTPEKFKYIIEIIKTTIRFDELGIAEKELVLRWLSGLGINLVLSRGNLLPASFGYMIATGPSRFADVLAEEAARRAGFSEHVARSASVFTRAFVYPRAYNIGYSASLPFFTTTDTSHAYAALGLRKTATEAEIKKRYRELAFKFHPDRCQGSDCNEEKIIAINQAAEILLKKTR